MSRSNANIVEHAMFDRLVERFCELDDFCQFIRTEWEAYLVADGHRPQRQHGPRGGLCDSEIMMLLVLYHSSRFKNFKTFYNGIVLGLRGAALQYYPDRAGARTKAEAVDITKLQKEP